MNMIYRLTLAASFSNVDLHPVHKFCCVLQKNCSLNEFFGKFNRELSHKLLSDYLLILR